MSKHLAIVAKGGGEASVDRNIISDGREHRLTCWHFVQEG